MYQLFFPYISWDKYHQRPIFVQMIVLVFWHATQVNDVMACLMVVRM